MSTAIITKARSKSQRGSEESTLAKWLLTSIALGVVFIFLLLPLINVFYQAFSHGIRAYVDAIKDPDSMSAIKLTLLVAAVSVPCNVIFGLAASWCIAKFQFPGKPLLITLIHLPFAISPGVSAASLGIRRKGSGTTPVATSARPRNVSAWLSCVSSCPTIRQDRSRRA